MPLAGAFEIADVWRLAMQELIPVGYGLLLGVLVDIPLVALPAILGVVSVRRPSAPRRPSR